RAGSRRPPGRSDSVVVAPGPGAAGILARPHSRAAAMQDPLASTPTAPKICHLCGQDCADRPRSKDRKGRYICQPCMDAAMARQRAAEFRQMVAEAPLPPAHLADPDPESSTPLDLAPEPVHAAGPCPKCRAELPQGAVICTNCGFSRDVGRRI